MYSSDYGYATSGGTSMNRASCLAKALINGWAGVSEAGAIEGVSDCYNNDWLYSSSTNQWTLSLQADSFDNGWLIYSEGYVGGRLVCNLDAVRPSVYLLSEMSILSGEGTPDDPYQIG